MLQILQYGKRESLILFIFYFYLLDMFARSLRLFANGNARSFVGYRGISHSSPVRGGGIGLRKVRYYLKKKNIKIIRMSCIDVLCT